MSKDCISVKQAREKLAYTGSSPATSSEYVTVGQVITMGGDSVNLSKYKSDNELVNDEDVYIAEELGKVTIEAYNAFGVAQNYFFCIIVFDLIVKNPNGDIVYNCGNVEGYVSKDVVTSLDSPIVNTSFKKYNQIDANQTFSINIKYIKVISNNIEIKPTLRAFTLMGGSTVYANLSNINTGDHSDLNYTFTHVLDHMNIVFGVEFWNN